MINNRTIESELNDLEREMTDLLMRISQLKKEVHKLIKTDSKPVYEQYVTLVNGEEYYTFKNRAENKPEIINLVGKPKGEGHCSKYNYTNCEDMEISYRTKKIIETYIPSKNLVLVVEL